MPKERQLQEILAKNIHYYRKRLNWSQNRLADEAGLSPNYISHLEQGRKSPSFSTLCRLAHALGTEVYHLLLVPSSGTGDETSTDRVRSMVIEEVLEAVRGLENKID